MLKVGLINISGNPHPEYATVQSAGLDMRASYPDHVVRTLAPWTRVIVPTGIYLEIPNGYECQVRSRSGLAANQGVTVLNAPGTIDSDYRGEVKVILINMSDEPFQINDGDRIAQLVFQKVEHVEWDDTYKTVTTTQRGAGGFGSTGIK